MLENVWIYFLSVLKITKSYFRMNITLQLQEKVWFGNLFFCLCRTFFPKSKIDYSFGQPKYTLLRKEKIRITDGEVVFSYKR